jgi:hypothetical protein
MAGGEPQGDRSPHAAAVRIHLNQARELAEKLRVRGTRRAEEARARAEWARRRAQEVRNRREELLGHLDGGDRADDIAASQEYAGGARESAESWESTAQVHAAAAQLHDLAAELSANGEEERQAAADGSKPPARAKRTQ